MKKENEDQIVSKALLIIKQLKLTYFITHLDCFKNEYKQIVHINEIKREILKTAKSQSEMNYLFIDKILKQIKLLLC